jgi:flagellin
MSTVINTNMASLYAQNNLSNAQNNLATSVQRLSSGLRINSAKDDAAGLAIAQKMQVQINGIDRARNNLNDAMNLTQVAETSLGTIQEMILRMKQLGVQGNDQALSGSQRTALADELAALRTEINNTATRTKFNNNNLIAAQNGNAGTGTLVVGEALTANASLAGITVAGAEAATYTFSNVGAALTLTRGTNPLAQTITLADTAVGEYTYNFNNLGISLKVNISATAVAADIATAFATQTVIVSNTAAPNLKFQSGADNSAENIIQYTAMNVRTVSGEAGANAAMTDLGTTIGILAGYTAGQAIGDWETQFANLDTRINAALDFISEKRADLGALQNQISYNMSNLEAQSTNLKNSKSAIIDTDFAAETANLTKGQIMQQAATAMLAQANQMPNVVLSLLK